MTDTPKDRDMDEAVERSRLIERALLFFELNASEGIFWDGDGHKIDPQDDLMEYANAVGIGESMDGFGEVTAHVKAALRAERDAAQLSEDAEARRARRATRPALDLEGRGDGG